MNNKNFIIVFCILLIIAIIALMSYLPARTDAALSTKVADFPKIIGEWEGVDIALDEQTYQILETRNLFIRDYKNAKGDSVYLYIVYSEDNRKVSHPPEVCLLGSGATIVDKSPVQITNSIKANKIIVEKTYFQELFVYWFKAGKLNTSQYLKQQAKIVLDRASGKRTSGALIRVSTSIKENNQQAAIALLQSFCAQIEPLLAKYVP